MKVLVKDEGMVELIKLKRYLKVQINQLQEEINKHLLFPTEQKICKAKLSVYREIYDKLQLYDAVDSVIKVSSAGHVGRGR